MATVITRRELLSRSTALLLLVAVAGVAAACGGSGGEATDNSGCDGVFETSSVTDNHTHTLCVPSTDISSPPSAGVTYTTSINEGHSHTVALTQGQLTTISGGAAVTVTTSSPAPHDFTISKG